LDSGSGYVKAIGSSVTVAQANDPVLLSFNSCQSCKICTSGHPSHCLNFLGLNLVGDKTFCGATGGDPDTVGRFFGQSSFASYTIVSEASVVNAKNLIRNESELKLLAPLGCGIQTGSGTVINAAKAEPDDAIAIMGLGGVGLSAIMGAKIVGCKTIIGIDKVQSRLDLAKELGATHVINTAGMSDLSKLVEEVQKVTDGLGSSLTVDTTGFLPIMEKGIEFTAVKGRYVQVGSAPMDKPISYNMFLFMCAGKSILGAVEGDVIPQDYVPKMVQWWREGKLPIEKLTKFFKAEDFAQGIQEMHDGSTVKPIIVW
jgi:Zn-dependent alcohol dehydrogenase